MEIFQIPIFASRAHAEELFDEKLPISELGALNELYTRIMKLSDSDLVGEIDDGGAPSQGAGYNAFGILKFTVDENGDITKDDANGYTLNELVDRALLQINEHRSYFGAFFGRLDHNVSNLSALTENLSAALSRVQDTDYGAETSALTRVQILQQAATAMLAQANAMPNVVLGLLKSQ
jgi:flagellin